jgi:hypothetical protein
LQQLSDPALEDPPACHHAFMMPLGVPRRALILGSAGLVMAGSFAASRLDRGDDGDQPLPGVPYPKWGLRPGDRVSYRRTDRRTVRLAVAGVYLPTRDYEYLRVVAVTVGADGGPTGLNLVYGASDNVSYIPIGTPAKAMSLTGGVRQAAGIVAAGNSIITPGLVTIVPGDVVGDDEPAKAGFRHVPGVSGVPGTDDVEPANGYAMMVTWPELARRLNLAVL